MPLSPADIDQIVRELELHPTFAPDTLRAGEDIRLFGATGEPAYSGTWVAGGGSWQQGGYFKNQIGFVYVIGAVKSGTIPTTLITLPVDYRPAADLVFPIVCQTAALAWVIGAAKITSAGVLSIEAGDNNLVFLNGIVFRAL